MCARKQFPASTTPEGAPTHRRVLTGACRVAPSFVGRETLVAWMPLHERRDKLAFRDYLRALGPDFVQHTGHQLGPDALPGHRFRHFRMDQHDFVSDTLIFDERHCVAASHLEAVHRRVVADHQHRRVLLRLGWCRAYPDFEYTSPPPQS